MLYAIRRPLEAFVYTNFLLNNPDPRGGLIECQLIGVYAQKGKDFEFVVRSRDGGIYSEVPLGACVSDSTPKLASTQYVRCPSSEMEVFDGWPTPEKVQVYDKDKKRMGKGYYMMSFVFESEFLNVIYSDGGILIWPLHKLMWTENEDQTLPGWHKRRYVS